MAFVENLAPFYADFGVAGVLDGLAVTGILDKQSQVESAEGVVTQVPAFELPTASSLAAAPGSTLVAEGVTYTVRQVLRQPPDGVLTKLVLARV